MKKGFSLVELSIVLVILGLLVGGVLSGQSLIRASELRSVTVEQSKIVAAINSFKDKYFALPGDMTNATDFWGLAGGSTAPRNATCMAVVSTGAETCNGNGDGKFPLYQKEMYRFWQHLANAGLIEGTYTGTIGNAGESRSAKIGVNVFKAKLSNAGFQIASRDGLTHWGNGKNWLLFGAEIIINSVNMELEGAVIKAEEAWNIDTKMDDGKPFTGIIKTYTRGWYGKKCPVGNNIDDDYDLSSTNGKTCALGFEFN